MTSISLTLQMALDRLDLEGQDDHIFFSGSKYAPIRDRLTRLRQDMAELLRDRLEAEYPAKAGRKL